MKITVANAPRPWTLGTLCLFGGLALNLIASLCLVFVGLHSYLGTQNAVIVLAAWIVLLGTGAFFLLRYLRKRDLAELASVVENLSNPDHPDDLKAMLERIRKAYPVFTEVTVPPKGNPHEL